MTHPPVSSLRDSPGVLLVASVTALTYAAVSGLTSLVATALGGVSGIAMPLYPSAGIALVAALLYGHAALAGVFVGSLVFNLAWMATTGRPLLPVPLLIVAAGATLQAMLGATLIRRFVSQPVVLNAPRDIFAFALAGAGVGCLVSASVATPALVVFGVIAREAAGGNWLTWWVGDALGVLVAAPLVLTLVGRPQADWRSRRATLGVPLLGALALLAAGMSEYASLDQRRLAATFERDADRMAAEAQARLAAPLHALEALKGVAQDRAVLDREALSQASRWWLQQYPQLQAMGYGERVAVEELPAFERAAGVQGPKDFRVFDRDDGRARAADQEVVALRQIEPRQGNEAALGVNALSIPAARDAVLATREAGRPAASAGFELTQSSGNQTGIVLYQALYRGEPADQAARHQAFVGVVFVTLRMDRAMEALASPGQQYLSWCLIDADPRVERRRLAGAANCESLLAVDGASTTRRGLYIAGRPVELRISASRPLPASERGVAWLLSLTGVAAAALLGALLLTVTGHTRRTELAVQQATAELRRRITERTEAQDALRESEARLRSILNHVPLGVMFLDPEGQVIDGNPRIAEMAGRSVDAMRGTNVLDMVHPDEVSRLQSLRRALLAGTTLDSLRLRAGPWALAGELRVRVSTNALRDPAGRVLRLVAVIEDITEHLQLQESERALHRAEAANRAKSEFLTRMSHELRTPLNAIIGFAQLLGLDRKPELVGHQGEWTQQILRAGWHLLDLINETLDLARIESGAVRLALEPVTLAPLVAACQAMVTAAAAQRGVRMAVAIDADASAVVADPTRLKQVVTNLLSNAVKYNREGGSVTLRSRRVAAAPATPDTPTLVTDIPERAPDMVEISVEDGGLGMTPQQLDELFQPYNRLGRENSGIEGTGIGLVISRRLSELMNGRLDASSMAGQGSTFTLRLPAATATAATVAPHTDTAVPPYQLRRVHYVEDNEVNVEVMRGIFAQRPQVVLEVSTLGLDGLTAIRANRPDLILLDMQLPDISGLELLRHLKQDDLVADIPVIVVSADATALHMERALTSGALHYVTKPLDVAPFLALVDGILENADTRWSL